MIANFSRRDFLKLVSITAGAYFTSRCAPLTPLITLVPTEEYLSTQKPDATSTPDIPLASSMTEIDLDDFIAKHPEECEGVRPGDMASLDFGDEKIAFFIDNKGYLKGRLYDTEQGKWIPIYGAFVDQSTTSWVKQTLGTTAVPGGAVDSSEMIVMFERNNPLATPGFIIGRYFDPNGGYITFRMPMPQGKVDFAAHLQYETPIPEFQNAKLARELGYSEEELRNEGFIGVKMGQSQVADLTYNGLLGIKNDGSEELIGFKFGEVVVKLSAKQVMELSDVATKNAGIFTPFKENTDGYSYIPCASTGRIENRSILDSNGSTVGFVQTCLFVLNDINGNPRFAYVPVQLETVDDPDKDIIEQGVVNLTSNTLPRGTKLSDDELATLLPYARPIIISVKIMEKEKLVAPYSKFFEKYLEDKQTFADFVNTKGVVAPSDPPITLRAASWRT